MIISSQANDLAIILKYLVKEPKVKSEKPPVIILLHGVGSNEKDMFSFADRLPEKYLVISARAPISLREHSFAWYQVEFSTGKPVFSFEQEEKSRYMLIKFIEQLKLKYQLDEKEIYLCGFSQGAIMSYSIALTRPDLIKRIAVISGRLLEEIRPKVAANEKLKQLRMFILHGINDQTLPIDYARGASAYLKTLNITPTYREYKTGHEINNLMLNDLVSWLK